MHSLIREKIVRWRNDLRLVSLVLFRFLFFSLAYIRERCANSDFVTVDKARNAGARVESTEVKPGCTEKGQTRGARHTPAFTMTQQCILLRAEERRKYAGCINHQRRGKARQTDGELDLDFPPP